MEEAVRGRGGVRCAAKKGLDFSRKGVVRFAGTQGNRLGGQAVAA
jgi:hypothetical protein